MVQPEIPDGGARDRRAEILRQAASVFREKGFHAAGMREIAEGVGLQPGALYYYFESKEDLLHACQEISLNRLIASARVVLAGSAPPDEQLERLIAAHLDLTLDELGGSAAHVEFHALPPEKRADILAKRDEYEGLLRKVIRRGIRTGTFRDADVKLTTMALLGALNWSVVWWNPSGPWSPEHLVDGFADVFVDGLRARPRRPVPKEGGSR